MKTLGDNLQGLTNLTTKFTWGELCFKGQKENLGMLMFLGSGWGVRVCAAAHLACKKTRFVETFTEFIFPNI